MRIDTVAKCQLILISAELFAKIVSNTRIVTHSVRESLKILNGIK